MKKSPTFVIAAGGTGGHMFPANALYKELQKRGYHGILFTDSRGASFPDLFKKTETHLIESGTYSGNSFLAKGKTTLRLALGFLKALRLMGKTKPIGVVGFGGFPVVPTMMAARVLNIPYCLHEQNAVLGRANRLMAKKAKAIALSFTETQKIPEGSRTFVTGNPVRKSIIGLGTKPFPNVGKTTGINILVFGGSQGAKIFSDIIPAALAKLPPNLKRRLFVTQQCRKEDLERVRKFYQKANLAAEVLDYIRDIPERLAKTHLVISRAGATSIFEFAGSGRPSILVPLPSALDDHQAKNASVLEGLGGAWTIRQENLTPEGLSSKVGELLTEPKILEKAGAAALGLAHPNAAKKLADLVENMALPKLKKGAMKTGISGQKGRGQKLKRVMA